MTGPALPEAFLGRPIAHRALHGPGRPENSRAAVAAALAGGFGIEVDLQLSADGVAMVFHDGGLGRLTDAQGPVRERTAEALSQIGLKGAAEGIPTLAEVLAIVDGRVPLLLEMKDQAGDLRTSHGRLEAAVARAIAGYAGPLAVMSFSPSCVASLGAAAPDRARGLVSSAFPAEDWPGVPPERRAELAQIDVDAVGASFISHAWSDLATPRVAELKARGCAVLCWTIENATDEAEARKIAQNVTFEGYLPQDPGSAAP